MPEPTAPPAGNVPVALIPRMVRIFTRCLPLRSGFGKLANGGYLPALPKGVRWVPLRDGGRILCFLRDYIGNALFYFGDLDAKVSWVIKRTLQPGDTFLDLGANVGILTILGSRLVGSGGKVLAVEPNPEVADMLEASLQANGCTNTTIGRYALGEENGTLPLQIPAHNAGGAALGEAHGPGIPVPVRVLREVLAEEGLSTPRTVKIDVEGFEVPVLKGVIDAWRTTPPEVILFEHRERTPAGTSEVGALMADLGYQLYRLPRNWTRITLVPESNDLRWNECSPDVVAVQPGSESAARLGVDA